MDDEIFNQIIEYDEGSDDEKENKETNNLSRQPKTTKDQFDMIIAFMEINNEELIDKTTFGQLWDNLAAKLNDIGPPDHTVAQWKKIWSAYKYNQNRKRSSTVSLTTEKSAKTPRLDHSQLGEDVAIHVSTTYDRVDTQSENSRKLDVLIKNQIVMIQKQDEIIVELKSSNNILQEIARKA